MQQVAICGWNCQSTRDDNRTSHLNYILDLPTPTWGPVVQVAGDRVTGAVGQGHLTLLSSSEVPGVNWPGQVSEGLGCGA